MSAAVSTTEAYDYKNPPPPLVRVWRHPLRWTRNKLELVIAGVVLGHIGTLIVVGLYYLLFQTIHPIKYHWDHLFSSDVGLVSAKDWNTVRHLIRNVGEGVLAGILVQMVIFNHFTRRRTKLNALDRLEIRLRVPNIKDARPTSSGQLLATPLMVLLYAIPGFVVGYFVVYGLKHGLTVAHNDYSFWFGRGKVGRSVWDHAQTVWTSNKDEKIIGFFASIFLGRRPVRAVADDVQGYLAARRVALGKPPRRYHPPNFRARMNAATEEAAHTRLGAVSKLMPAILSTGIVAGAALAGFGLYVLLHIAQK